jgi:hypothetical protein
MKRLLIIVVAIFALVMSQELNAVAGLGGANIPLIALAGGYSSTVQGSFALCLDPDTFALESCATLGALVLPLTYLAAGQITWDFQGNACGSFSQVQSDLPVDVSPPQVSPTIIVGKLLNYSSATGGGDESFTAYSGGSCNGPVFNGTGATVVSTGTDHFVVSGRGSRLDGIFTSLTDASSAIGDFSISFFDLKQ